MSTTHPHIDQANEDEMITSEMNAPDTPTVPETMRAIVQHRYG